MIPFRLHPTGLAALAVLAAAAALPAAAGSSASSASLDGSSASVGSLSTSLETSSNSSSQGDKVAQGDYRIIDITAAPARPGFVRVTLQALAVDGSDGELFLTLPRQTAAGAGLAPGALVSARQRDYGLEFAHGEPRQAFFLVLRDERLKELQTRPVML